MYKSGFVSISGQPNVGKSTMLNGFLQKKIAIVSNRPETTRDNIRGILTTATSQIIFIDTPGIHRPHNLLGKLMLSKARSSMLESDIILFVTEKPIAFNEDDLRIIAHLPERAKNKPVICIINKVDRIKDKAILLPLLKKAEKIYPFDHIIPICALKQKHLEGVLETINSLLPEGPELYPADQITDQTDDFLIKEIIREKILLSTYEEVPHSVAVIIDKINQSKKKMDIFVTILVERPTHKSIIIGKGGSMLKKIGILSREELEEMFKAHINLNLWVKVFEKWKKNDGALKDAGYSD